MAFRDEKYSPAAEQMRCVSEKGARSPGQTRLRLANGQPGRRRWFLERTRSILRTNYAVMAGWLAEHAATLTHLPPRAGAMLYLRYRQAINSTELTRRLRKEKGVLVVPGDHYGMDGYLRMGFGNETDYLQAGLERVTAWLRELESD